MSVCKKIVISFMGGIICLAVSISWANTACAQVIEEAWEYSITPYAWMAGIDGDVRIGNTTTNINVDFGDIWEDFDVGGMLQVEIEKNTFGLFAQPSYFKVSDEETLSAANGEIETEVWVVEFGGFYRLAESKGHRVMTFDFLFGGRYWDLSNEIKADVETRYHKELIDPMLGLRLEAYLTDRLYFNIRIDVGGFGIGGSTSEVSWQAQGLFGLDVGDTATLFLGYRDLNVDTDTDQNAIDLTLHGPIMGIGFTF